ncbi:MAG: RES family NAD+ phosphorylase [Gemmatimonadaceae bacterium]
MPLDFEGLVWRYVPRGAHPLHVGFILLARGRWNRQSEYGCLYTSLSPDGARAEYAKELARLGIGAADDQPKDLVSLDVGVSRVLDLTDATVRKRLRVARAALTGDTSGDLETCRLVADLARLDGYDAILSPSAARAGARNLNLYIDRRADHVRLMEGPDRGPLNY